MVGFVSRRGFVLRCGFSGWFVLSLWVWWMVCAANVGVVGFVFRWVWWLICVASVGVVDFHSGRFGG